MMNMGNMLKQAQQMQTKMAEAQAQIDALVVEGQAGGHMVMITLNGHGVLQSIKIDPKVITPDDHEMLEDLIIAACGEAKQKLDEQSKTIMNKAMGGLKLPAGMNLPF